MGGWTHQARNETTISETASPGPRASFDVPSPVPLKMLTCVRIEVLLVKAVRSYVEKEGKGGVVLLPQGGSKLKAGMTMLFFVTHR